MLKNVRLTAASLQKALPKGVMIHASADDTFLENPNATAEIAAEVADMQAYVCASCDTHLTAAAGNAPFCVNCGSVTVEDKSDTALKAKITASTVLAAVGCSSCGTTMTLQASALSACGNRIHCSSCGEHLSVALPAAADEYVVPQDLQASDDIPQEVTAAEEMPQEVTAAEDVPVATEVEASEAFPEGVTAAGDGEALEPEADLDDMLTPEDAPVEEDHDNVPLDASPSEEADVVVPDDSAESLMASDGTDVNPEELVAAPEEIVATATDDAKLAPYTKHEEYEGVQDDKGSILADALGVDDTANNLSFVAAAGRLVAMKGHMTLFSLRASDAGDNVDLMTTPQFVSAVQRHVQKVGLRAGLRAFGFRASRVPVTTAETVKASVQAATTKLEASHKRVTANLEESLAIAATGLNKGRLKDFNNPLKAALVAELQALGVRNSGRVIAKVFDKVGLEYTRNLLAAAQKISVLSAESRKDMKDMLNMTREVTASDDMLEEDPADTSLEARLTASPVTASNTTTRVAASSVDEYVAAILSNKAPLTFN